MRGLVQLCNMHDTMFYPLPRRRYMYVHDVQCNALSDTLSVLLFLSGYHYDVILKASHYVDSTSLPHLFE